ncbi:MAG: RiPP maturation radical SAM C-methyltransferase [Deltaproteobacteria bacterium]|nr:RiPP maturation radical SAM C-methyltransferase [Deltaproteobacteria bacterium]
MSNPTVSPSRPSPASAPRRVLDVVRGQGGVPVAGAVDRARGLRVALVNMPLSSSRFPSIQLGLLKALLDRIEIPCSAHHFNLEFGAQVGWEISDGLAEYYKHCSLLGEWVFAGEAFGDEAVPAQEFLSASAGVVERTCALFGLSLEGLVDLRQRVVPRFLRWCLESIDWSAYDVVGLSSVFQQNCAALAMARLLKQEHPHLTTVFGGANFDDEMGREYVRGLPWVDYAVVGDAETSFPALLEALACGCDDPQLPGVAYRKDDAVVFAGRAAPTRAMDELPTPDYDDFFDRAGELGLPAIVRGMAIALPFESARGCWWGAKHHCTFCGMTAAQMAFRSKSPSRVRAEIDGLAGRYGIDELMCTDAILDNRYIDKVFAPLSEDKRDYSIFYEVKANLRPKQLRTLARAGVRTAQPGIESLSTPVLALMDKGTTGIQNVRFLKWGRYYGIDVKWHMLRGFPGELREHYEQQLETMRLIPHLQPPGPVSHVLRLDRFSPNYQRAEALGFRGVRPWASYAQIYPRRLDLDKIAYSFDYDELETLDADIIAQMDAQLSWWCAAWNGPRPYLFYLRSGSHVVVVDGRDVSNSQRTVIEGVGAEVFEACVRTHCTVPEIVRALGGPDVVTTASVEQHLGELTEAGFLLRERDAYLNLALPKNPNW